MMGWDHSCDTVTATIWWLDCLILLWKYNCAKLIIWISSIHHYPLDNIKLFKEVPLGWPQYLWGAADEGGDNEDYDHHCKQHTGQAHQGQDPIRRKLLLTIQTNKTIDLPISFCDPSSAVVTGRVSRSLGSPVLDEKERDVFSFKVYGSELDCIISNWGRSWWGIMTNDGALPKGEAVERCGSGSIHLSNFDLSLLMYPYIQGVFFNWPPPESSKYKKVTLG